MMGFIRRDRPRTRAKINMGLERMVEGHGRTVFEGLCIWQSGSSSFLAVPIIFIP
jgi:hypothetical protein